MRWYNSCRRLEEDLMRWYNSFLFYSVWKIDFWYKFVMNAFLFFFSSSRNCALFDVLFFFLFCIPFEKFTATVAYQLESFLFFFNFLSKYRVCKIRGFWKCTMFFFTYIIINIFIFKKLFSIGSEEDTVAGNRIETLELSIGKNIPSYGGSHFWSNSHFLLSCNFVEWLFVIF